MNFIRRYWQWMIVSAGAASAIMLGYWGLYEYFLRVGQPRPFWDIAYSIVYLFVIESEEPEGPVPWQLAAARWLAAGVAFWAVAKTVLVLFHEQMQLARPAKWRGHVRDLRAGPERYPTRQRISSRRVARRRNRPEPQQSLHGQLQTVGRGCACRRRHRNLRPGPCHGDIFGDANCICRWTPRLQHLRKRRPNPFRRGLQAGRCLRGRWCAV